MNATWRRCRPRPGGAREALAAALAIGALVAWLPLASAAEGRLGAKGDTLRGRVVDLTSEGVSFEPIHGKGAILVPWADVESLETDDELVVMHGDDGEARGRVLAFEAGALLVGSERATAERIEVGELFTARSTEDFGDSPFDRVRSRYRYWRASLDAGASYTDATTDTVSTSVGLFIERRKAPTRLLIEGQTRYANQKEDGEDRSLTEGLAWGLVRGEYDFTERFFSYASTRGTYDATQHLSLRLEPRAGLGVHVVKSPDLNLSTDIGAAWIYEDYFGHEPVFEGQPLPRRRRGSDDSWAVAFGAQADAKLPFGALWRARVEYLPAVDDWVDDYLLRGETSVDFPLLQWLAFRVAVADEYDNTPAPGSQRNRLTSTAGLSFRFP